MKYACTLILVCVVNFVAINLAVGNPLPAPRGWEEQQGDSRVLIKGSSRLEIGPWKSLDGLTLEKYMRSIENLVPSHTKFVSSKGIKPEGNYGAFTITRNIRISGKDGISILFGCPGQPGYARIIEGSFLNSKFGDVLSGGLFGDKVCKKEPKGGASDSVGSFGNTVQTPSVTGSETLSNQSRDVNRSDHNRGNGIKNISSVWHTGDVDGLGVYWRTYLTFNDGMATHDIVTFINEGRARSESENPKKWRPYKVEGDTLLLGTSKGGTREPFLNIQMAPGASGQRYDGCWVADKSFIPSATTVTRAIFRSETYCFSSSGQYSTDASAVFTTDGIASSNKSSDNGLYQIDGHMITLQSTSGESQRSVFGWYQFSNDRYPRLVIGRHSYLRE